MVTRYFRSNNKTYVKPSPDPKRTNYDKANAKSNLDVHASYTRKSHEGGKYVYDTVHFSVMIKINPLARLLSLI